ncbi:MAG: L,D-transpeptidase [Stigonema ocellatum SAG 48.90 = DSM 106950]|nr:L,D-transpeptidase [Stigonema ocellatum SAG 48.90 = DSM 106950]
MVLRAVAFHNLVLLCFSASALVFSVHTQAVARTLIFEETSPKETKVQTQESETLEEPSKPNITHQTYLLIKLSDRHVYFYREGKLQASYPIAVGKAGWETPTGIFEIIDIQRDPVWENPFTGKIIRPGANNPLGSAWIGFWTDGTNQLGFHGTRDESLVGQPVSHGCIRMRNRDILKLYQEVTIGMRVEVVP